MRELRIGIIAGEPSGDALGAGLIQQLRKTHPHASFTGIGGQHMIAAGCRTLFPMEHLSIMGLGVIPRLPKILSIRRQIRNYFLNNRPDIFIGIDVPDFNLTVEEKLRAAGIPTLHYVSPSVWAWKQWRIKKIKRAVNMMLAILPFETRIYEQHNIPVRFVGHPLADAIPMQTDRDCARAKIGIPAGKTVLAILPGSRGNEIKYLAELFLQTARWCQQRIPNLVCIAPMVNQKIRQQFTEIVKQVAPELPLYLIDGNAQLAMTAADVVLLASGTASLETMLVKRPMVVAYRLAKFAHFIARNMVKVSYISLPNLLANKPLVPELIQHFATVESLGSALLNYLENPQLVADLTKEFTDLHQIMKRDANEQAARAVLELCKNVSLK